MAVVIDGDGHTDFSKLGDNRTPEIKYGIKTPGKLNPSSKKGITTYSLIESYNDYLKILEEKTETNKFESVKKMLIERKKHPVESEDINQRLINDLAKLYHNQTDYRLGKQPSYKDVKTNSHTIDMEREFSKLVDEIFDKGGYYVLGERTIEEKSMENFYYPQDTRIRFLLDSTNHRKENFTIPISKPVTDVIEIRLHKDNIIGSLQIVSKQEAKEKYENLQVFKVGKIDDKSYISRYQYLIDMHQSVTKKDMLLGSSETFTPETFTPNSSKHSRVFKFLDKELNLTS